MSLLNERRNRKKYVYPTIEEEISDFKHSVNYFLNDMDTADQFTKISDLLLGVMEELKKENIELKKQINEIKDELSQLQLQREGDGYEWFNK